jgi:hypothetical protein
MKDFIGVGLVLGMLSILIGPILFARQMTIRKHKEQFKATGGQEFALPSARSFEAPDESAARPEAEETHEFPMDQTTATIVLDAPTEHLSIINTETGEVVRLGADGLPLSPADIAARTAPTAFTVDPERLDEILNLEKTGEYVLNPATWAEITAAELFMLDPLGSCVLPPTTLTEEAGNPSMRDAFRHLVDKGRLTYDWEAGASEFKSWGYLLEPAA